MYAAYNKIKTRLTYNASDADCLKMGVFFVNRTVGLEGLCPILLTFCFIPRPTRALPSIKQLKRSRSIDTEILGVEQVQAWRRIAFVIRHGGGPQR